MPSKYKLRDISEFTNTEGYAYLQKRISAGGHMKTSIKRFVDAHPEYRKCSHMKQLIKSMEHWCNGGEE